MVIFLGYTSQPGCPKGPGGFACGCSAIGSLLVRNWLAIGLRLVYYWCVTGSWLACGWLAIGLNLALDFPLKSDILRFTH